MTGTSSPRRKIPLRVSLEDVIGLLHGSFADPRRPLKEAIPDLRREVTDVKPIDIQREGEYVLTSPWRRKKNPASRKSQRGSKTKRERSGYHLAK